MFEALFEQPHGHPVDVASVFTVQSLYHTNYNLVAHRVMDDTASLTFLTV